MQRIYCILHTINLIGKRFFTMIDGGTSGPGERAGPLGKKLTKDKMHLTAIVDFEPIPTLVKDLEPEVVKNLSNDYKYNYKFCKAIAEGPKYFMDPKHHVMITASPGKYHQARWLPLFNRCLRVYVQTPRSEVTPKLKLLVTFFTQVISPAWFNAIENPSFLDGPSNFQHLVSLINNFELKDHVEDYEEDDVEEENQEEEEEEDDGEQEEEDEDSGADNDHNSKDNHEKIKEKGGIRKKSKANKQLTIREALQAALENNSYFAHFESVVPAMMFDSDPQIRQRGLKEFLRLLRKQEEEESAEGRRQEEDEHPPKKKKRTSKKEPKPVKKVREFRSPQVDLTVPNYWNFIDNTPDSEKTMPPIFIGMTEDQLRNLASDPSSFGHMKKIAGNTQNVERWIKNITQISLSVKSSQRREEEAANLQYSRITMPHTFTTKKDYFSHHSTINFASQQPGNPPAREPASKQTNQNDRILRSTLKKSNPQTQQIGHCASCQCIL